MRARVLRLLQVSMTYMLFIMLPVIFMISFAYQTRLLGMEFANQRSGDFSRRQFMHVLGCAVGSGVMAACGNEQVKQVRDTAISKKEVGRVPVQKKTAAELPSVTPAEISGNIQSLDLANWRSWTRAEVFTKSPNNELQKYIDSPSTIRYENGSLVLEAHGNAAGNITSGRLFSGGKFEIGGNSNDPDNSNNNFGRLDVSAKLPTYRGSWPAIWLFDKDIASGTAPEIDIMELVGAYPEEVNSSAHDPKYNPANNNDRSGQVKISGAGSGFHTYSVIWLPNYLETLVDGKRILKVEAKDDPSNPFYSTKMGLVLNHAVGGDWGAIEGVDFGAIEGSRMEINRITFQPWK